MHPVSTHGAHKITMNSAEADYEQRKKQAMAQADGNSFVTGARQAGQFVGDDIRASRTQMGAVRMMPQELIEGAESNFKHIPSSANVPLNNPEGTTGNVELGTSATKSPSKDPSQFQTQALEDKLGMYAKAVSNAGYSLNDRYRSGSLN
jgi:hypothetical protein